jgi:cytochrome c-type biogenesis protein CcmF
VNLNNYDLSFLFKQVKPETNTIEIEVTGLDETYEEDWVLIVAEKKPFISVVWTGTFLLMGGFSISIFRHWGREKAKNSE